MAGELAKIVESEADNIVFGFDYRKIPAEHRDELKADAFAIRSNFIRAAGHIMDTGRRLARWRDVLPHGAWLPWLEQEARMSGQKARDAINVFRRFENAPTLLQELDLALPETALVRLATAPESAFEDVQNRIIEGEVLRADDVADIVKQHRKQAKGAKGEEASQEDARPSGADVLRQMADRARDELVPLVIARLVKVLFVIEDAEMALAAGKSNKRKLENDLRGHAQWLTDALEQVSGRRAASETKLVHNTMVERAEYEPGPWADAATFLRDIAHSLAWEKIPAEGIPDLLKRGRAVLTAVLSPDERRSFFRMP